MTQDPDLYKLNRLDLIKRYQRLQNEFESLRTYLPDAMVEATLDLDHPRLVFMNRMAYLIFRYTREDFVQGISVHDLFASREEYERIVKLTWGYVEENIRTRTPYQRTGLQELYEAKMKRKNGEVFFVEGQSSMVLGEEGIPIRVRSTLRDISKRKALEEERENLIQQLQSILKQVEALEGLLPTCASCKKIRDKEGNWHELEAYIESHSEAEFSHGICPDCLNKYYSDSK